MWLLYQVWLLRKYVRKYLFVVSCDGAFKITCITYSCTSERRSNGIMRPRMSGLIGIHNVCTWGYPMFTQAHQYRSLLRPLNACYIWVCDRWYQVNCTSVPGFTLHIWCVLHVSDHWWIAVHELYEGGITELFFIPQWGTVDIICPSVRLSVWLSVSLFGIK